MKALVVTWAWPPPRNYDAQGIDKRLALFMGALAEFATDIEMLHIVPREAIPAIGDPDALGREQSERWDRKVSVALIPRRPDRRQQTFWNYHAAGIFRAGAQPPLYAFTGDELARAVAQYLDQGPDIVFVQQLRAMLPVLRAARRPRNLFFDINDVEHRVSLRQSLQPPIRPWKLASLAHLPALLNVERQAMAASRLSFVCSELDRVRLRRLGMKRHVAVVPNAVVMPPIAPPPAAEATLLFLGACDYLPNAEAAERLVARIMPLIRAQVPQARLLIAGRASMELPSRRGSPPGVEYLGFVEDLDALYARARVVCAPIVNGGGTRVKLVEAAAYARPMVSTRVGAEGLAFADGQDILLRDDDRGFADACIRLLRDDALRTRLGDAARQTMRRLYDAESIRAGIARMMRERLSAAVAER